MSHTLVIPSIFCLLLSMSANAQTLGTDKTAQAPNEDAKSALDRPTHLPRLVLDDTVSVLEAPLGWDKEDWTHFGFAAAALAATAMLLDRPMNDAVLRNHHDSWDGTARHLESLGSTYAIAAAGGFYLTGWLSGNNELRATGTDAISASLITGLLIVPALKYTAGRARPVQDLGPNSFKPFGGKESFPSGHTTEAFAVASVITAHYPGTWVQITAYGLASLAGLARLEQNAHWTSDILAGALIGTSVGKAVTRLNQQKRTGKLAHLQLMVAPDLRPGFHGIQVGVIF